MCDEKFRNVQENELQNLKTSFGHSNVEDLRSNGEFVWKPLNVKILLCRQGKLDKGVVSIEFTVVCDANYPEVEPQFFLDNGKGLSDEFLDKLTSALKIQIHTLNRGTGNTIFELAQTVQEFLNEDELLAVQSPTQSIKYSSSRDECVQHQTSKILHFIDVGRKIQQGCCLGHSSKGCIAFSGIDLETGQLLYITEWFITNTQLKVQCEVNGCDMQTICRKHGVDEIIANINKQSAHLTQLRHENLIHYEGVQCVKEQGGIRIYLAQDFVLGNSIANVSNSFEWCEQSASIVASGVVQALLYLQSNGVSHNLLCNTEVHIDNCSNIRVTDFMLVPYLQRLIGGESVCVNDDSPTPSSVMRDFIEKCKGSQHDAYPIIEDLLDTPLIKASNNILDENYDELEENKLEKLSVDANTAIVIGSRFENDFTQLQKLGEGAFGEVFKVQHNVDKVEYAIKKIPLEENSRKLYKFITKEVQLLSGIYHENIVRYNTSWIEARPKSEDKNKDADKNKWSSSKYTSSQREFFVFENEDDDDTSDDEDLEWDDSMERFLYIQMEYCGGNTLREAIDNGLYTDNGRVWRYFREICEGLAYLHKQDIIHRDLKPDNIFIDASDQIKIGDFGLATRCGGPQECPENDGLTEDDSQYNPKEDLYQLGIILFEMSTPPCPSNRFIINEDDINKPEIIIPENLLNKVPNPNVKVIKWLLQFDPCLRPSIDKLLTSGLVPPGERDICELQEKIRSTITNPQTIQYKNLVAQLMAQKSLDLTYNAGRMHRSTVDFVKWKIMKLFRKHGGVEVVTPLLTSCSKNQTIDQNAVRLMTHSGSTIFLPHNLRLPFARHIALKKINTMRRYSIGHVYREEKVFNCHPKQLCECAFDIITPTRGSLLVDAELLSIAYDIINEVPALRQKKISFRINHTTLLRAILMHFKIPTDKCDQFFDELQQYSNDKITDFQLKQILRTVVENQETVMILCNLLQTELQIDWQSNAIFNTIFPDMTKLNFQVIPLTMSAIGELQSVVTLAQKFGVSCAFNLALGLTVGSVPTKSGRILWQMMAEVKLQRNRKKRFIRRVLASGERYDSFSSEFQKPLGDFKDSHIENVFSGAGFTFSLDNIMQILAFTARNNLGWSPISVVLWMSGLHAPLNDVTAMLKSLWDAGISSGVVEATSLVEARHMAKNLNAGHIIELNSSAAALTLHSFISKDILCEGKKLTRAELVNTIQRMLKPDEQNLTDINNGLLRQIKTMKRQLSVSIKKSKPHERPKKSKLAKNNKISS